MTFEHFARRSTAWIAAAALVASLSSWAHSAQTVYFPHADARYLRDGQREGGAAFIPSGITMDQPVPVVVILHGTNSAANLHVWLGGARRDLRALAQTLVTDGESAPFVLAAPSQTRSAANARTLWAEFDLGEFVSDLRTALGEYARIDEHKVALLGHSGAGCNPTGGLASEFSKASVFKPFAIVAIDPCLDAEMGQAFLRGSGGVPLWMYWQTRVWPRDPTSWFAALSERTPEPLVRALNVTDDNPHEEIVPQAFASAMRELFPAHVD